MSGTVDSDLYRAARSVIVAEAGAVAAVAEQIGESFDATVDLLLNCPGKVFVAGAGTSGTVARRLAHLLSVSGTPAVYMPPADALHGSLGAITGTDIVICISKGGSSAELNEFTRRAKVRGAAAIAMTARADSELANISDVVVVLTSPAGVDPGEAIAMGSTLAMSAWGDALAVSLMRIRRYPWTDVLFSHPSGHVGTMTAPPADLEPLRIDGSARGDQDQP